LNFFASPKGTVPSDSEPLLLPRLRLFNFFTDDFSSLFFVAFFGLAGSLGGAASPSLLLHATAFLSVSTLTALGGSAGGGSGRTAAAGRVAAAVAAGTLGEQEDDDDDDDDDDDEKKK